MTKQNFLRLGMKSRHEIKDQEDVAVPLSEFCELATPFVSLFHRDFEPWISGLQADHIIKPWSKASRAQKEKIISEYMLFFFE